MITDGDTMGVPAQIAKYPGRAAECWFRVDDPILPKERAKKRGECLWMYKRFVAAAEVQSFAPKRSLQLRDKLASEDAPEHFDRQEECVAWSHPLLTVERKTSGRNHAMQVWMQEQVLSPRMEDGEEADAGAEVLGIGGNFERGFRCGFEQQIVQQSGVVSTERIELVRQGEYDMEVRRFQQFLLPRGEPAFACLCLTLGAVPITTGVIRDG